MIGIKKSFLTPSEPLDCSTKDLNNKNEVKFGTIYMCIYFIYVNYITKVLIENQHNLKPSNKKVKEIIEVLFN